MMHRAAPGALVACAVLLACKPPVDVTPAPPEAHAEEIASTGASVMVAVGDIASCSSDGDERTAALVDSVLRADSAAGISDVVATLGDNVYPDGSTRDFAICFAESWGDSTRLILDRIRPSVGNHEHNTRRAAPYYAYFGDRAGDPEKGYYAYDLGEWRVLVINSEMIVNSDFSGTERRAQEDWLRAELENTDRQCVMAYWHQPPFSSGHHGSDSRIAPIWDILAAGKATLVLFGHDHHYERFHPSTSAGVVDSVNGMSSFLVGTGGGELRGMRRTLPNSARRIEGHFGVLKLSLGRGEYRSIFLDTSGGIWDPSGGTCRRDPTTPPDSASTGRGGAPSDSAATATRDST